MAPRCGDGGCAKSSTFLLTLASKTATTIAITLMDFDVLGGKDLIEKVMALGDSFEMWITQPARVLNVAGLHGVEILDNERQLSTHWMRDRIRQILKRKCVSIDRKDDHVRTQPALVRRRPG